MHAPVIHMKTSEVREIGRKAQKSNILAAKAVSDVITTCLGPNAMLKMLLDPMGGIVLTNDGHAVLREIDVSHPAAKSIIELSRAQDEEIGDGTTTVTILTAEILQQMYSVLEKNIHTTVLITGLNNALKDVLKIIKEISVPVDTSNKEAVKKLIKSSIGTKYIGKWMDKMCSLAYKAVNNIYINDLDYKEIDIKRYVKIEKIPGGDISESEILDGVLLNKDVTHSNMKRYIKNPRVILLDCPLEYKKGESQTNIEITKVDEWDRILSIEEEQIKILCEHILDFKPDLVITEKGISDLAQHYLMKGGVSAIRRVRKSDNNRISRVTGATILNKVEDLKESNVGTRCGLFKVDLIGDEYFSYLIECKDIKACTIVLRGPSKDILNEVERNLHDALSVTRNIIFEPFLSPGCGATEMTVSVKISKLLSLIEGRYQPIYQAVSEAFEIVPKILIQNSGANVIKTLSELRSNHLQGRHSFGIDGITGDVVDMNSYGIWEPLETKLQSVKTAFQSSCMLLKIDDIFFGIRPQNQK